MKIVITPETDDEKRDMPEEGTVFGGVDRHILIMAEKFHMTGNVDVLRTDVDRLGHYFDKLQTVGAVQQAMKQIAVAAQVANGQVARPGERIIRARR